MLINFYRRNFCLRYILIVALLAIPNFVSATGSLTDPQKKVSEMTQAVIARLASARERLKQDPEYIETIVAYLILPHVDFRRLTAAALSNYWESLSEGEHRCITIGVREQIVQRYARVLLETDYHNIVTDPVVETGENATVFVTQTVTAPEPGPFKVKYELEAVDDDWRIVDLIVERVSLVASYRMSFATQIEKEGIGDFLRAFPACRER